MNETVDMRHRLVAAAVRMLLDQGPAALQARPLAREVGASTMAVYHHFGGMPQLLSAVIDEGFRRLDGRLTEVEPTDDTVTDLASLALAYRAAARENPHLYDLMFGLSAPAGHRKERVESGETEAAMRAYGHLVHFADRAIQAGRLKGDDAEHVAAQFWSILHGYVTLELSGHFSHLDDLTQLFLPMATNLLVGLGDEPERAATSAARCWQP